jgi:hypothetical protein
LLERVPGGVGVDGGDRLHVAFEGVPVSTRAEPEGVADQMDDAGLHDRLGPHVGDHLGEALQPVADHKEHVAHATVAEVGEHAHPELRALTTGAGHNPKMSRSPSSDTPIAA